ncbi:hypothetical protein SteCoe_3079 [Stentor coeruleus]|uniref:FCP1 homology domain-containing protein n=1 Tax=Stentor coeruleus TaxID=5963 RepID=A0A1R2CY07_9CILI|nr:hypothetical protein SteCoe_3079 [Stentor coeruleus]
MIHKNFLIKPQTDKLSKPVNLCQSLVQAGKSTIIHKYNNKNKLLEAYNFLTSYEEPSSKPQSLHLLSPIPHKPNVNLIPINQNSSPRDPSSQEPSNTFLRHDSKSELKFHKKYSPRELSHLSSSYENIDFHMLSQTPATKMLESISPLLRHRKTPDEIKIIKNHSYKKTIALDLDETLIYSSPTNLTPDHIITRLLHDNSTITIKVSIRPYVKDFLRILSSLANIIIFTASAKNYADTIIDLIDPNHKHISARYYRDSCVLSQYGFIKDLNILKKPLKDILLIDNLSTSFLYQKQNGILIQSWYGDKNDTELYKLLKFLQKILLCDDFRKCDKNFNGIVNL